MEFWVLWDILNSNPYKVQIPVIDTCAVLVYRKGPFADGQVGRLESMRHTLSFLLHDARFQDLPSPNLLISMWDSVQNVCQGLKHLRIFSRQAYTATFYSFAFVSQCPALVVIERFRVKENCFRMTGQNVAQYCVIQCTALSFLRILLVWHGMLDLLSTDSLHVLFLLEFLIFLFEKCV